MMVQQMQAPYGQLPGGSPYGANVMNLDGGGAGMPPSPGPGSGAAFSTKDSGAIQQKMARQRQLALERRRAAGRQLGGCMAQANQLPVTQVQAKAPGWDRVLCEGIDKPGSLAEKTEAAFNDAGKNLVVKTSAVSEKVEENFSVEPVAKPSGRIEKSTTGLIEEIEDFDVLDVEVPRGDVPRPVLIQKGGGATEQSKGMFSLETEPASAAPGQQAGAASGSAQQDAPQSRWYKPSTWRKPAAGGASANGNELAPMAVNTEVQRIGLKTPPHDSDWSVGPTFNSPNGPSRRRPRRQAVESPPPTRQPAVDLDAMMCPGAIFDDPLPVMTAPAIKALSNPKHASGGADRAAFPSEERARNGRNVEMNKQIAEQEAEMNRIKEDRAAAERAKPKAPTGQAPTGRLAELEAQKKDAIGREDFMEAQRIKGEIEKLQSQSSQAPPQSQAPPGLTRASPAKDNRSASSSAVTQIEPIQKAEEPSGQPAPDGLRKRFWKPFQSTPAPTSGNAAEASVYSPGDR